MPLDERLAIRRHSPGDPVVRRLVAELDGELRDRYPLESIHGLSSEPVTVLVAWLDGRPVGCGMLTALEPGACEIKRMYVEPGVRGRGIGGEILGSLEHAASDEGFRTARLETGAGQPEAVALYERNGYVRIPCFGEYAPDPLSLCYEKRLRT